LLLRTRAAWASPTASRPFGFMPFFFAQHLQPAIGVILDAAVLLPKSHYGKWG
jgi:hypothetical protein